MEQLFGHFKKRKKWANHDVPGCPPQEGAETVLMDQNNNDVAQYGYRKPNLSDEINFWRWVFLGVFKLFTPEPSLVACCQYEGDAGWKAIYGKVVTFLFLAALGWIGFTWFKSEPLELDQSQKKSPKLNNFLDS